MATELGDSKYAKKLSYRMSRLGVIHFKDKITEFETGQSGVPIPLMPSFVGPHRGPGRRQQQVYTLLPHENFAFFKKFATKHGE